LSTEKIFQVICSKSNQGSPVLAQQQIASGGNEITVKNS
jgi:hypothetical protein